MFTASSKRGKQYDFTGIWSRQGKDLTGHFPDLIAAAAKRPSGETAVSISRRCTSACPPRRLLCQPSSVSVLRRLPRSTSWPSPARLRDIDGHEYEETWFVDCKHYKRGAPPDALQGTLAWAVAERPAVVLFMTSGYLTNGAKDWIADYRRTNRLPFRIRVWEKPQLLRLWRRIWTSPSATTWARVRCDGCPKYLRPSRSSRIGSGTAESPRMRTSISTIGRTTLRRGCLPLSAYGAAVRRRRVGEGRGVGLGLPVGPDLWKEEPVALLTSRRSA